MNKYIEDVMEFHKTFEHPVNETMDVDLKTRQLRVKLLFEELEELAESLNVMGTFQDLCLVHNNCEYVDGDNVDKVETLDALCDIQYVLSGAVLALGHQQVFDDAFQNVQDSNMSKGCETLDQVKRTMEYYKTEKGVDSHYIEKDGMYIVLRNGDNKVLKNVDYTPTDLKKFIS